MRISSFMYSIRQGIKNIKRNLFVLIGINRNNCFLSVLIWFILLCDREFPYSNDGSGEYSYDFCIL